jgi:hypothetical protein
MKEAEGYLSWRCTDCGQRVGQTRDMRRALEAKTACKHHESQAECPGGECLDFACHVEDVYYLLGVLNK